ncbi:uncharacterized protein LOC119933501 isoform X4 [Tachyglossus aculeatus]|uniref:uncharacterized protein LOC119933501 isoform X4 n=1 Tax=Tachyglossus aculeatus TaxID=9261 RepID=UPI0018F7BCC7|nr:uncharacterized protein LOC119933501 isoform X4 [Tachyglossus aculeatus]
MEEGEAQEEEETEAETEAEKKAAGEEEDQEEEEWLRLRPVEPRSAQCCGSGCRPCIFDLYQRELARWEEARARKDKGLLSGNCGEREREPAASVLSPDTFQPFSLSAVDQLTDDTFRFRFTLPANGLLGLSPGQHIVLRAIAPDWHPGSSGPGEWVTQPSGVAPSGVSLTGPTRDRPGPHATHPARHHGRRRRRDIRHAGGLLPDLRGHLPEVRPPGPGSLLERAGSLRAQPGEGSPDPDPSPSSKQLGLSRPELGPLAWGHCSVVMMDLGYWRSAYWGPSTLLSPKGDRR